MTELYDRIPARQGLPKQWVGAFVPPIPNSFDDLAYVIIPDLDSQLKVGPCRWQARDTVTLPASGDEALVVFDNDNSPWVVAWWPF
jgi:hypothetical protein